MALDDGYTSFLMHFDGIGSFFTEESGRSYTSAGNVIESAAQSKFGGKSAYFDGVGDYLYSTYYGLYP